MLNNEASHQLEHIQGTRITLGIVLTANNLYLNQCQSMFINRVV